MKFVFCLIAMIFAVCAFQTVAAAEEECHDACPLIYLPLCARDDDNVEETFPNTCVMNYKNCNEKGSFVKLRSGSC